MISEIRTAHLVYGPVAAGKSTHAATLAADLNAVRFAIDDWMHVLFAPDRPTDMSLQWAMARVARCRSMIWTTAAQILNAGRDVVLEVGLMRGSDRDQMRAIVEGAGHRCLFHFVDADRATRLQRLARRNVEKGATYSFEVTRPMFDAADAHFEPPGERERDHRIVLKMAHVDA